MSLHFPHAKTIAWIALSLCLASWTAFGLWRGLHSGFSGGLYDPSYRVPGVIPGSAAARAGFQPGDRIITVEGRPVEELGMESRWPRSLSHPIGSTQRFVVQRAGQYVNVDYVYPAPSSAAVANRISSAILGLGFLAFGLWAFLTSSTSAARALLPVALAAGIATAAGLGPGLGSWNGLKDHLSTAATALQFLFLFRFFLLFPQSKPLASNRPLWWSLYGLWACLVAFLIAELMVHPALYYTTGSFSGPLILLYGLLILAALAHTLWKGPRELIRSSGLLWILGALIIALGAALSSLFPSWSAALPALLVPFTLALAARKQRLPASPQA